MRSHACYQHPEAKDGRPVWASGPVSGCPYHRKGRRLRRAFIDRAEARRTDREAGVVGTDRGSFISGT